MIRPFSIEFGRSQSTDLHVGLLPVQRPFFKQTRVSFPTRYRPFGHENVANAPTARVPESTKTFSDKSGSSHVISLHAGAS